MVFLSAYYVPNIFNPTTYKVSVIIPNIQKRTLSPNQFQ